MECTVKNTVKDYGILKTPLDSIGQLSDSKLFIFNDFKINSDMDKTRKWCAQRALSEICGFLIIP